MEPPIVVPGDQVYQLPDSGVVRVGTGLRHDGSHLVACRPGFLQQSKAGKLWILGKQKRYIPSVDDAVLGVITSKGSEYYEVNIGAPFLALLPVLAFEGATRRNRPNLKEGDLVYCRVDMADRDLQPTVTCVDGAGRASGFGPLTAGFVFDVSTLYARTLISSKPTPTVLLTLGSALQFELAIGVNGRIWVNAPTIAETTAVASAIQACEREAESSNSSNISSTSDHANKKIENIVAEILKEAGIGGGGHGKKKVKVAEDDD